MALEKFYSGLLASWIAAGCIVVAGCAQVAVPDARTLDVPTPKYADERERAINERPDSVMYLPLGEDVLVPEAAPSGFLSFDEVGPFEIRSETLAGSLQLILADYDISLAFETDQALSRRITVANLRGPLHTVVNRVCGLADLYCSYEDGILIVKDTQTFTVSLPPIGDDSEDTEFLDNVVEGLGAVLGEDAEEPISDPTTRTIVYSATQRTADIAARYFQRLRASTALVVFETYIWEVQLNAGNSTGIDWDQIDTFGKFNASFSIDGSIDSDFTNPVSIGLPTTQNIGAAPTDLVQFLSQFGAVKSISQPQITVLSGSTAELRVADTENFVSEISTTIDEGQATTSVSTDSVDSGFELTIGSSWDKSTVYANIDLALTNVISIANFTFSDSADDTGTDTTIQLPQTSERELTTNIRIRPGDSVLIAGLVTEDDRFSSRGPGSMKPIIPDSRTANVNNLELVILLRPRVVVYTPEDDYRYQDFVNSKKSTKPAPIIKSEKSFSAPVSSFEPEPVSIENDPFLPEPIEAPTILADPAPAQPQTTELFYDTSFESPQVNPAPTTRPSSLGRFGNGLVSRVSHQSGDTFVPSSVSERSSPQPVMDSDPMISSAPVEIVPIEPAATDNPSFFPSEPAQLPASDLQPSPYETYHYYVPSF